MEALAYHLGHRNKGRYFITRIKGKRNKHLVVQIQGILAAAIEMSPEMIELSSEKRKLKSKKSRKTFERY